MNIENVDAEIVEEGKRAFTMPEEPVAPEAPEPEFTEREKAGTNYEQGGEYVEKPSVVLGVISLVCGIIGIVCCCFSFSIIISIAAVVLGIISLKNEPNAKTMAIIGIVCGAIGGVIGLLGLVTGLALKSAFQDANVDVNDFYDFLDNLGDL